MDLVVLDVLIRKARTIKNRLGISVPVPAQAEQVVQAVVDSVLLRRTIALVGDPTPIGFHRP